MNASVLFWTQRSRWVSKRFWYKTKSMHTSAHDMAWNSNAWHRSWLMGQSPWKTSITSGGPYLCIIRYLTVVSLCLHFGNFPGDSRCTSWLFFSKETSFSGGFPNLICSQHTAPTVYCSTPEGLEARVVKPVLGLEGVWHSDPINSGRVALSGVPLFLSASLSLQPSIRLSAKLCRHDFCQPWQPWDLMLLRFASQWYLFVTNSSLSIPQPSPMLFNVAVCEDDWLRRRSFSPVSINSPTEPDAPLCESVESYQGIVVVEAWIMTPHKMQKAYWLGITSYIINAPYHDHLIEIGFSVFDTRRRSNEIKWRYPRLS